MFERIASNGVRVIIVETANRFARDLMIQEAGHQALKAKGIALIAADIPDVFVHDTPTEIMVRQILGAVAQFEKSSMVGKLKGARDRKRATGVKVEGRKGISETHPEAVALAKKLHRANPRTGEHMSLRKIAAKLADAGLLTGKGQPFSVKVVMTMVES